MSIRIPAIVIATVAAAATLVSPAQAQVRGSHRGGMASWPYESGGRFRIVDVTTLGGPGSARIGNFFDIFIEYRTTDANGTASTATTTLQIPVAPAPVGRGRFRIVDVTTQNTPAGATDSRMQFHVTVDGNDGGTYEARLNGLPPGEPVIGTLTVYGETNSPDINKGDTVPVSKMFVYGKDGSEKTRSEAFFDITY